MLLDLPHAGEPRSMEDPANRAFLEAIGRKAAPPELLPSNPATMVTVNLVCNGSDFQPPVRSMAFTGRGRTLAGKHIHVCTEPAMPVASSS